MTGGLRKAVFFALVIGLTVVGYQYMIKPANTNLADAKTRVDMKLAKLAEYEKATAAAEDLTKQLAQLEEAISFFESRLPPKSQIDEVLKQVTMIVQKEGLKPKTIRTLTTNLASIWPSSFTCLSILSSRSFIIRGSFSSSRRNE